MNTSRKGITYEREIVNIFKAHGYTATRSAASHSPYDVILWKTDGYTRKICFVAFVQCKIKSLSIEEAAKTRQSGQ